MTMRAQMLTFPFRIGQREQPLVTSVDIDLLGIS